MTRKQRSAQMRKARRTASGLHRYLDAQPAFQCYLIVPARDWFLALSGSADQPQGRPPIG
jgi:hypothetical protein